MLSEAVEKAATIVGERDAAALVKDNPQAVLNNKELPYFPIPINPKEKKKSLNIRIPNFIRR